MIDAGQVVIKLIADTGGYKTSMQNASSVSDKAISQITGGIKALGAVVSTVIAKQMVQQFTEFADQASRFDNLTNSFNNFASAVSGGGPAMMRALKRASGGMIAQTDLMKSYNKAAQLVSRDFAETLPQALPMLQKVAASTGTDLNYLLDSFVVGIGRKSKLILDNMGITTDAEAANRAYADSIGKSVSALTEEEKQLALTNQVISLLQRNTEGMADISDTVAGRIARIKATWEDMRLGLGVALLPLFESAFAGVETFLGKMVTAIEQVKQGLGIHSGERDPNVVKMMEMEGIPVTDKTYAEQFSSLAVAVSNIASSFDNVKTALGDVADLFSNMEFSSMNIAESIEQVGALFDAIAQNIAFLPRWLTGEGDTAMSEWSRANTRFFGSIFKPSEEGPIWKREDNDGLSQFQNWMNIGKDSINGFGASLDTLNSAPLPSFKDSIGQINQSMPPLGENAGIVSETFTGMGVGLFGVQNNARLAATMLQTMLGPDTTTAITGGAQTIGESFDTLSSATFTTFDGIHTTMAEQADEIRTTLANKTAGWVSIVRGFVASFYSTGASLMNGLAQGIIDRSKQVIEEVVAAVKAVADAAYKAAESRSPSRVFMRLGENMMEGLAIGIDNTAGLAMDSVNAAMGAIIPKTPDAQNTAMVAGIEDMNHKLDQMPIWFREAVQMLA